MAKRPKRRLNALGEDPYLVERQSWRERYLKEQHSDKPVWEMWTSFFVFTFCIALSYRLFIYAAPNKSDGVALAAVFFAAAALYMFNSATAIVAQIMQGILWSFDKLGIPFMLRGKWTLILFLLPMLLLSLAITGVLLIAALSSFNFLLGRLIPA